MDYSVCNIIYVDRRATEDKIIKRDAISSKLLGDNVVKEVYANGAIVGKIDDVDRNIQTLLKTFSEVHICRTGGTCVSRLSELHEASSADFIPTLVLVDIPYEDQVKESKAHLNRTPSPMTKRVDSVAPEDVNNAFYGLSLLRCIALDIQQHNLSRLVVPVAVVTIPGHGQDNVDSLGPNQGGTGPAIPRSHPTGRLLTGSISIPLDQKRTMKYLDAGAVDVLTSPLLKERLPSLAIHAYRAHKDTLKDHNAFLEVKRGRKRSWVGLDDQKPYAYLREAMVSGLMDGICRLGGGGDELPLTEARISVPEERSKKIKESIGTWYFSAHDFSDDELLHAAMLMLQHALQVPELEQWRISAESLTGFLVACRAAYNAFVPYHNFRHVIDVLQAVFHFLVRLDTLPPYPVGSTPKNVVKSPIAALLRPFDALTLLITAIGHDVGHPGVNNAFLVILNAPLAQLYNDRSVLESFHCAAYSQILRRYWPAAFSAVEMRQLMISSILATDMGLHFDYMKKLGFLQEKLHENGGTDGFNGRLLEEYRALACALLIKCADISNVARRYEVAAQWTMILTDEFARQASMEADLGIPTALFAPPVREIIELGKSQVSFMNMFAIPLFQGITDIMPAMQFTVDELHRNISLWSARVEEEQQSKESDDSVTMDGMFSPRAMSLAIPSDTANQQGTDSSTPSTKLSLFQNSILNAPGNKMSLGLEGINESDFQDADSRGLSESPVQSPVVESDGAIESESLIPSVYSVARRSSKPTPSQLQLSYATVSAPGLLDHPAQAEGGQELQEKANGNSVGHSLVTEAVVRDQETPTPRPDSKHHGPSRTSDTTDGSNSVPGSHDWASQATSATTSKIPLSPSTRGTSIMSNDSAERTTAIPAPALPVTNPSPTRTSTTASQSCPTLPAASDHTTATTATDSVTDTKNGGGVTIVEAMRSLARKSSRSRFRMSFWKKKPGSAGSGVPPVPGTFLNGSADDEARGRSRGGDEVSSP